VGVPSGPGGEWDVPTLRAADVLIVDEISMLTSVLVEALDIAAREARLSSAPFGGLQLILCGDFMQLIPETQLLFESKLFKDNFAMVGLRTALRHRDNTFREALLALRVGKFHPAMQRCFVDRLPNPLTTDATFLFPRRASAQQVNDLRLEHIALESPDDERVYHPQRGVISLCGNFSSACIVSVLPTSSSMNNQQAFSTRKICDQVEHVLNIHTTNNDSTTNKQNEDQNEEQHISAEKKNQSNQSNSSSSVFSMVSRSGLTPQVVFRLKHPLVGRPVINEQQWRDAIQQVLSTSFPSSYLTWHFDDGQCSDIVPLEIATALGAATNCNNNNNMNEKSLSQEKNPQASNSFFSSSSSSSNSSQQNHQQAIRLRKGCRVMVNRNLSKDVVNGSIGTVVRFEEPDPTKFPFGSNPTMMRLFYQKGGKQAMENYGLLPVVRFASASSSEKESNNKNDEKQQQSNEEGQENKIEENNNQEKEQPEKVIEFQIPPMFVTIGGGEETSFYQQSSFYLPLQLGFALTVHKCQGLTILGRVVLDLRELTYRTPHLVYVACSRVRDIEQLSIVGLNPQKHLIVDGRALEFSDSLPTVDEVLKEFEEEEDSKNKDEYEKKKKTLPIADWVLKKKF
jgi:hypothetical protein